MSGGVDITRRRLLQLGNAMAGLALLPPDTRALAVKAAAAPVDPPPALDDYFSLFDFEERALATLAPPIRAFVAGAAGDELTMRWNRESLDRIRLAPRNLHDVARVATHTVAPGLDSPIPILVAPIGFQRMMHADGEVATVRGAGAAGATMVVSMGTSSTIEAIVGAASRPVWSQLYMVYSRSFVHDFVERVQAAGVHAIVATIDTASNGPRNRQDRAHFAVPADLGTPHLTPDASQQQTADADFLSRVTWRDLEWLRGIVRLPLWVKGVLDPDDADRAVRAGVSGIIVSNHGGRNLDGAPATIDVLPHIVQRVAGRVPVLMDGGIRRGTDIIKAVALGARAVLVGRPVVYGLSVGGADGVQRVLEILTKELLMGMQLVGRPSLASIDRSVLWSRSP